MLSPNRLLALAWSISSHMKVVLEGDSTSAVLKNLTTRTDYLVSVFPIYVSGVGSGLRGITSTCKYMIAEACYVLP